MTSSNTLEQPEHHNDASLIATAGLYISIIITLALVSMISSILVTERLAGDAELLNKSGALRLHLMRVSRADLLSNTEQIQEKTIFNDKLANLKQTSFDTSINEKSVKEQYLKIIEQWQILYRDNKQPTPQDYDLLTDEINKLVYLIQLESEHKLSLLRLIQSIAVFIILIISAFALIKLNQILIIPLRNLVYVAEQAGKGNFETKITFDANNELGLLATTIKQMSTQLSCTYQDYEQRVQQKTTELTRSNQSLALLYKTARQLTTQDYHQIKHDIINDVEELISAGRISIKLIHKQLDKLIIYRAKEMKNDDTFVHTLQFSLKKHNKIFGDIIWQLPPNYTAQAWQEQLLQAMADIVATAIELEQQKNTENRLLISEERAIIARELHDSLAQSLSFLKVQMSLLTRKMEKQVPKPQIDETISEIKLGLNNAYLQLRELLTTFRLKLDAPTIESALQGTVAEFSQKCQHPIRFNYNIEQNCLSANQEIHLLQIIREALSNIQRHAKATTAGISLTQNESLIVLTIWDDGQGFNIDKTNKGHFGLNIMRERTLSLSGKLVLANKNPSGTIITMTFNP
ncbi:histidine kinase [Shewanella marina]|uniref:histidine kinase n=1 Tax=Shewanella marina TaxID=487319 RepID=UPI00046F233B|nr:histidine kinase [Shewanella marina]